MSPYHRAFDSWEAALEIAPLDPQPVSNVPDAALIYEALRAGLEIDSNPTTECLQYGRYPVSAYRNRFGGIGAVREQIPVDIEHLQRDAARRERLLAELQRLTSILKGPPETDAIRAYSIYRVDGYQHEFGSILEAIAAANHAGGTGHELPLTSETVDIVNSPGREPLIEAIRTVATENGDVPTPDEVVKDTQYTASQFDWEFDSWGEALAAAGVSGRGVQRHALIDELKLLYQEMGRPPTVREMAYEGRFSASPYYREFGSWTAALEAADIN